MIGKNDIAKGNISRYINGQAFRRYVGTVIPIVWLVLAFVLLSAFIEFRIDSRLDSDMASELVLAKVCNEEGSIMASQWYYSTELRVLSTQLVFAPLFSLFDDWHTVRVIGSMILYGIMLFCYAYFCRQIGIRRLFLWTAPFLLLPVSEDYEHFVLEFASYPISISISFITLGLVLGISQCEIRKKSIWKIGVLGVLSLLTGLGGARQLLILYIPLLFVTLLLYLNGKGLFGRPETDMIAAGYWRRSFWCSMEAFICSVIGFLINNKLLAKIYYFQSFDEIRYTPCSLDGLIEVWNGFLYSLGYKEGSVFSMVTIRNGMCILLLFLIIVSSWHLILGRDTTPQKKILGLFFTVSVIIFIGLYVFTDMLYVPRHSIPIIVMALPVVGCFLMEGALVKNLRTGLCVLLCLYVTVCGVRMFYMAPDTNQEIRTIAAWLTEQGYQEGYATFWNGSVLTELSDDRLRVWVWHDGYPVKNTTVVCLDQTFKWLQRVSNDYTVPEGKFFILFSRDQAETYSYGKLLEKHYKDHVVYESTGYIIYGFENYDDIEFMSEIDFEDGEWLTDGTQNNGIRLLNAEGISNYTYITLKKAGIYQMMIKGKGLNDAEVNIAADAGKDNIPCEFVSHTDEEIIIEFSVESCLDDVECYIKNVSDEILKLDGIVLRRM